MEGFIYLLSWLIVGYVVGTVSILNFAVSNAEMEHKNRKNVKHHKNRHIRRNTYGDNII